MKRFAIAAATLSACLLSGCETLDQYVDGETLEHSGVIFNTSEIDRLTWKVYQVTAYNGNDHAMCATAIALGAEKTVRLAPGESAKLIDTDATGRTGVHLRYNAWSASEGGC